MHAKFSPSKLPRIVACPGSVQLIEAITSGKDKSSVFAEEGTMLHKVIEEALTLNQHELSEELIKVNSLDEDQSTAVNDILEYITTLQMTLPSGEFYEFIETKVSLAKFAEPLDCEYLNDVYGTLDYLIKDPSNKHLYVLDHKFGKGVEVFPDSEQLKAYAVGALRSPEVAKNFSKVTIIVAQPRLYGGDHFKHQTYATKELLTWLETKLVPALNDSASSYPMLNPCDKACKWCPAKIGCHARHSMATSTAQEIFKAHADLPHKIKDNELAKLLGQARDLKTYIADIEVYAIEKIKSGGEFPGYKLVAGRSTRKFIEWEDVVARAEEIGYEEEDLYTMKPKSPAQIEKLVGRKAAKEYDLAELVHKPEGKPTLVNNLDKREPLKFQTAGEKFAAYAE